MPREEELQVDSGARMDTYHDDDDDDDYGDSDGGGRRGFGDLDEEDKLSVNMDDIVDEEDEDTIDLSAPPKKTETTSVAHAEESKDENNTSGSEDQNKSTGGSSGGASSGNLFAVGESTDKGLADMETGSEVYMSELLVSLSLIGELVLIRVFVYRLVLIWKTSTRQRKRTRMTCSAWVTNLQKLTL
jgi:hypothetical protein